MEWSSCVFPSASLVCQGAHVCHVLVATSVKAACTSDRLRRCEPPPSRTVFSRPQYSLGRLAQLFHRHTVLPRLAPVTTEQAHFRRGRGPGRQDWRCAPCASRSACAGTAAVRTAWPVPVASSSSLKTVHTKWRLHQHATAQLLRRRRDAGPSSRWSGYRYAYASNRAGRSEILTFYEDASSLTCFPGGFRIPTRDVSLAAAICCGFSSRQNPCRLQDGHVAGQRRRGRRREPGGGRLGVLAQREKWLTHPQFSWLMKYVMGHDVT